LFNRSCASLKLLMLLGCKDTIVSKFPLERPQLWNPNDVILSTGKHIQRSSW